MSVGDIDIRTVSGAAVTPWLDDLAALRIRVFRDYPYLYDGSADYERRYLTAYARSPGSLFVLALAGERVVGAATALPLIDAEPEFRAPFEARGMAAEQVLYFGESVLDQGHRGLGIGHRFFDRREAHARDLDLPVTAFCAVVRGPGHPACPPDYRPLDPFWRARGFQPEDGMTTEYRWRDLGDTGESPKTMQFWLRKSR